MFADEEDSLQKSSNLDESKKTVNQLENNDASETKMEGSQKDIESNTTSQLTQASGSGGSSDEEKTGSPSKDTEGFTLEDFDNSGESGDSEQSGDSGESGESGEADESSDSGKMLLYNII